MNKPIQKKKNIMVLLIVLISIIFTQFVFNAIHINRLKKYETEIDSLNIIKNQLEIDLKRINDEQNDNFEETKRCNYIKTYKILHILNDYHNVLENTFIIVDEFQNFSPFVLEIPSKYLDKIKENNYYEFYINGSEKLEYGEYQVEDIKKTNKTGFDQIQESCDEKEKK